MLSFLTRVAYRDGIELHEGRVVQGNSILICFLPFFNGNDQPTTEKETVTAGNEFLL